MLPEPPFGTPELRSEVTAAANLATVDRRADLDRLIEAHYAELCELARRRVGREAVGISVEPTALVNMVYERLIDDAQVTAQGSLFFRAGFAKVARRILIERARTRHAQKRGGGMHRKTMLESGDLQIQGGIEVIALHEAMEALARVPNTGERMAKVVEMRVFAGMTEPECAAALGVSLRTISQDWLVARKFLKQQLEP